MESDLNGNKKKKTKQTNKQDVCLILMFIIRIQRQIDQFERAN